MISRQLLLETLLVQTASHADHMMVEYLVSFADKHNIPYYIDNGNIYMTKGEAELYPCIASHMDTVHEICKNFRIDTDDDIFSGWNADTYAAAGIGGDDKVGVFVALHCLLLYPTMKAAFFRDEEIGCKGAEVAHMPFFDDVAFVIECDRRGNKDIVDTIYGTKLMSPEFANALRPGMERHDFHFTSGALTDVYQLKQLSLPVSCFNMSAGYYRPHTENELVIWADVKKTVNMVEYVCDTMSSQKWPHEYVAPVWERPKSSKRVRIHHGIHEPYSLTERSTQRSDQKWLAALAAISTMQQEQEMLDAYMTGGPLDWCDDMEYNILDAVAMGPSIDECPNCDSTELTYDRVYHSWLCIQCGMDIPNNFVADDEDDTEEVRNTLIANGIIDVEEAEYEVIA